MQRDPRPEETREAIRKGFIKTMWSTLARPLEATLRTHRARVGRYEKAAQREGYTSYAAQFTTPPAKRKLEVYQAYVALLEKLLDRMRKYKDKADKTPAAVAIEKEIPNNGRSWVDWIPTEIKLTFTDAIASVHEFPDLPIVAFPNKVKPLALPTPRPSQRTKRPVSKIELIRDECKRLDRDYLLEPTPEKAAVIAQKSAELAQAKLDKNRANAAKQYAKIKAEREALKARLKGEMK
jgi:hypothetical protein